MKGVCTTNRMSQTNWWWSRLNIITSCWCCSYFLHPKSPPWSYNKKRFHSAHCDISDLSSYAFGFAPCVYLLVTQLIYIEVYEWEAVFFPHFAIVDVALYLNLLHIRHFFVGYCRDESFSGRSHALRFLGLAVSAFVLFRPSIRNVISSWSSGTIGCHLSDGVRLVNPQENGAWTGYFDAERLRSI